MGALGSTRDLQGGGGAGSGVSPWVIWFTSEPYDPGSAQIPLCPMAQEVPIGPMVTRLMKPIGSRMRLNEPRGLHEPAPHRILQGPDEPPKSDGRIHYRTSQWLYAVYGLETTQIWPTFGNLKTLQ